MAAVVSEMEVLKFVMNWFAYNRNVRIYRRNTGAVRMGKRFVRFGVPGMADLSGIVRETRCPRCGNVSGRGVRLEIEVKKSGGKLTSEQKEWLNEVTGMGGIALAVKPVPTGDDVTGLKAVEEVLRGAEFRMCEKCS